MRTIDDDSLIGAPSSASKSTSALDRNQGFPHETFPHDTLPHDTLPHDTLRKSRSPGTPAYLLGRPEGEWRKALRTVFGRQRQRSDDTRSS